MWHSYTPHLGSGVQDRKNLVCQILPQLLGTLERLGHVLLDEALLDLLKGLPNRSELEDQAWARHVLFDHPTHPGQMTLHAGYAVEEFLAARNGHASPP